MSVLNNLIMWIGEPSLDPKTKVKMIRNTQVASAMSVSLTWKQIFYCLTYELYLQFIWFRNAH